MPLISDTIILVTIEYMYMYIHEYYCLDNIYIYIYTYISTVNNAIIRLVVNIIVAGYFAP